MHLRILKMQIEAVKSRSFKYTQSPTEILPKVPFRGIIIGPSAGGKSNLTLQLLTNKALFGQVFDKIHWFSASADVDSGLEVLDKHCVDNLGMGKGECLNNTWDEEKVKSIMDEQRARTSKLKSKGERGALPSICIVCDDFGDDAKIVRSGSLQTLYIRGRHLGVSTLVLSQKLRALSPLIRVNATCLFLFKLRNKHCLDAFLTEHAALVEDVKVLREMYDIATNEKYGFLYVDLMQSDPNQMFYKSLSSRLVPRSSRPADET